MEPGQDVNIGGEKGEAIEALLRNAMQHGAEVLHDLCRSAFTRLLQRRAEGGLVSHRLFTPAELDKLAEALAIVCGTSELLGRATVRDWQRQAQVDAQESLDCADCQQDTAIHLPVPVCLQDHAWSCGAAGLRAVLALHGLSHHEARVAEAMGTDPVAGTRPSELHALVQQLGLPCEYRHELSLDDVRHCLAQGAPVLCPIQMHGGGHWVVVSGLDESHVYVMDPIGGEKALPRDEFEKAWEDKDADGVPFRRYGLAVGPMKAATPAVESHRSLIEDLSDGVPLLTPEKALEYFLGLTPDLGVDPLRFGPDLRRRSFTLAVATDAELLDRVQALLADVIETGEQMTNAPAILHQLLDDAGVSPRNPQYCEMVVRTTSMEAYTQGTMDEMRNPDVVATFPVWRYSNPCDSRSRPTHAAKNGNYYPNSVDFADVRGRGPEDVCNDRCVPIPINKFQWRRLQAAGARIADGYDEAPIGEVLDVVSRRLELVLVQENFSGERRDALGRRMCFQNGRRVPCPSRATAAGPRAVRQQVAAWAQQHLREMASNPGAATPERLRALKDNVHALTVPQLRAARQQLGASFGGATRQADMAAAIRRHVKGMLAAQGAIVGREQSGKPGITYVKDRILDPRSLVDGAIPTITPELMNDLKATSLLAYGLNDYWAAKHKDAVARLVQAGLVEKQKYGGTTVTPAGAVAAMTNGEPIKDPTTKADMAKLGTLYRLLPEGERKKLADHFGIETAPKDEYEFGRHMETIARAAHNKPIKDRIQGDQASHAIAEQMKRAHRKFGQLESDIADARADSSRLTDVRERAWAESVRSRSKKKREAFKAANDACNEANRRAYQLQTKLAESRRQAHEELRKSLTAETPHPVTVKTSPSVSELDRKQIGEATAFLQGIVARHGDEPELRQYGTTTDNKDDIGRGESSAHYDPATHSINAPTDKQFGSGIATHVHEMAHGIEYLLPGLQDAAKEFRAYRLGDEPLQPLREATGKGYGEWERGAKDNFDKAFGDHHGWYVGKQISESGGTEIVSMGVEKLYENPTYFATKDPEYFRFIVGILKGTFRNKPIPEK